ncbi:hypothetical protein CFC21_026164 [Triticum aestivum]|uniref:Uncharacterized protein n=2 Tax=Triticum aestivum TaxID=4565 RepID=A0A9R1EK09_WHEAT|nr:hypothetical protein CFC21_024500 [Triticum aestivum]KAF7011913.1 hypothetical protein CFC21_026164 [Triticum aestivum]
MAANEESASKGMAGHEECQQNCSVEKCSSTGGRCASKRKAEEAEAAGEECPLKVCKVEAAAGRSDAFSAAAPDDVADSLKPAVEAAVREKRLTRLPQEEINWTLAHVVDGPVPDHYESLKRENPSLLPSPAEQMDSWKVVLYNGCRAFFAVRERFAKYQALVRAEYEKRGYVEVDDDFLTRRAHLRAYNDVLRAKAMKYVAHLVDTGELLVAGRSPREE